MCVGEGGVFPCLWDGTIVPDVSMVRVAVVHKTSLPLLRVLENGVEWLILGNFPGKFGRVPTQKIAVSI